MPSSDYAERLADLGYKRITLFVRPDRAELVKAQEAALIADDLVDIATSITEDEGGISDDRIDFFTGQKARGLPNWVDLDLEYYDLDPKSDRAKALRKVYMMVQDAQTYEREHDIAARLYAAAALRDKFAAGLRYRLAFAKMYAHTRRAVTYHRLYEIQYKSQTAVERAEHDTAGQ